MRKEKKKNEPSTAYSSTATPTDTSFSSVRSASFAGLPSPSRSYVSSEVPAAVASAIIAKSPASAGSLFVFKSPFWQSTMSAVVGSSTVTVTGSVSDQ